ncbi:hypothetical protein FRC06_005537 [Ceratobasidium sp. 370]|nr:hypothetical protein FRC06_005537 [Ceratobasidium sp. 370]
MILQDSERSDSKVPTVRSGDSESWHEPPSPPPYSATVASDDSYQGDPPMGTLPTTSPRPELPPRCNHLIEQKTNHGISGTWHVDTGLIIPEPLLPPITEFDGSWNQDVQKARKIREKEMKRRERGRQPPPPPVQEVRPNLMLASTNGSIKGDIHIVSSDGLTRQAIIVVQGTNGSINLTVNASPHQPLRIYATSTNGAVTLRIPMSFEGAVMMSTTWGGVRISDAIKAKLMTFSSTSNTTRCFIGDWKAAGFGTTHPPPDPNDDPPLPTVDDASSEPFASWSGPLIRLGSTNGSVSLSFIEESTAASPGGFARAMRNFMSGWFGGGGSGHDGNDGGNGPSQTPPRPPSAPGSWPGETKHPDGKGPIPIADLD